MQTPHNTSSIQHSRARAARWGLIGGPILALAAYAALTQFATNLTPEGRITAAAAILIAVFWMTEAMPLAATSLLPLILFPLGGVMSLQTAAEPYANKLIFLFMGGFMIALAIERWGLHRRIALHTIRISGTRPTHIVAGFMAATAFLSMWVSNTATTVMMLPIALSVIHMMPSRDTGTSDAFATCLLLSTAYAASIGGVATLIGTPPNLFMASFLEQHYDIHIGFARWMLLGVPLALVFLVLTWLVLTRVLFPLPATALNESAAVLRNELRAIGPMSRGERTILIVASCTAAAWVLREPLTQWDAFHAQVPIIDRIDDTMIAIAGALALFLIPVEPGQRTLDWPTARKLPWDILLLFGGGLSLAAAIQRSELDMWIGSALTGLAGLPLFILMMAIVAVVIFLTEITSNTATAATFLPIMAGLAANIYPDYLTSVVVPAALAASFAFMLPVATPPNAIVFGSGHVTIPQMVRAGFWLNILGILLIPLAVWLLNPTP